MSEESVNESPTILVVEDNEGLRTLLIRNLKKEGFNVAGVERGKDVLSLVEKEPDCLLLVDYLLPDMTGKELVRELKEKGILPPFIVMTGHGDEKIAVERHSPKIQ